MVVLFKSNSRILVWMTMKDKTYDATPESRKYRKKIDIIADMLSVADEYVGRTKIMYQANLSYKLLKKYLNIAMKAKLLEKNEKGKHPIYKRTARGEFFLERYRQYIGKIKALEGKYNVLRDKEAEILEMFIVKTK